MAARLWNKAPFVRLLAALSGGVVLQWYLQGFLPVLGILFGVSAFLLFGYAFLPIRWRFRLRVLSGISLFSLLAATGGLLVHFHTAVNNQRWFGHSYRPGSAVLVTIEEPLVEKAASYKAIATVQVLYEKNTGRKT